MDREVAEKASNAEVSPEKAPGEPMPDLVALAADDETSASVAAFTPLAGSPPAPAQSPVLAQAPAGGPPAPVTATAPAAALGQEPSNEAAPGSPVQAGIAGESAPPPQIDPAAIGFEAALAAAAPATQTTVPNTLGGSPSAANAATGATGMSDPKALAAQPTAPQAGASAAPVPVGAVPMTIGLRALGGINRFELRLDPVELGCINVALEIDRERGSVSARLVVERPETLALLQRDASNLQQALAQAGLDASAGISLSLRGEADGRSGERQDAQTHPGAPGSREGGDIQGPIEAAPLTALRALGGIDIRI